MKKESLFDIRELEVMGMQRLKTQFYKIAEKLGLRSEFLILLFKTRRFFGIQSEEEKRLVEFYKGLISNKSYLIFDIGANVGIRTSVFSRLSKSVIAVEPNHELVKILESRFKGSNVTVLEKACGAEASVKEFFLGENHLLSTFSTSFINHKKETGNSNSWSQSIEVETISLDHLVTEYGVPDFCKIDVEGYEKEVLSGLSQKLGVISFEFNYPSFENETLFCLKKLNDLGYSKFNFSIGESLEMNFHSWVSFQEIYNFFKLNNFPFGISYGDIYAI